MKKRAYIAAVFTFLFSAVFGQSGQLNVTIPEATPSSKKVINLSLDKNQSPMNYANDVVYVTQNNMDLHLQIIFQRSEKPLPCIVYVQGSAWMKQNVYANMPQLMKFAQRGYSIAIVEYRHSDVAPFPAQVQDARTAIRFMRKNARQYNIDPNNIFIWGDSSGGHTAVFCGITTGISEFDSDNYKEFSDSVNAIVDFYGPTDVSKMSQFQSILDHVEPTSPEGKLLGGVNVLQNIEKAQKASPMTYISEEKAIPPILIAHGSIDALVPFNQSDILAKELEENDKTFEFYNLKGANHGSAEFWTKEMFDIVEAFIKKNTK